MTDSDQDELAAKISLTLERIFLSLDLDVSIIDELGVEEKVRIFSEAMSASGLTFLNYVQSPSERGVDNG